MDLPQGATEIIIDNVEVENDRGTTWLVTHGTISQGEGVGQRVKIKQPISGVCGKVEFETE